MTDMRIYDLRVTVERIEGRSVCGLEVVRPLVLSNGYAPRHDGARVFTAAQKSGEYRLPVEG